MAEIIQLNGEKVEADVNIDDLLEALKGKLDCFVLFGYDNQHNEVSIITVPTLPEAVWMAQRGIKELLERVDEN